MRIVFLVQATTGRYEDVHTRIVAAWPTLEQAEQHRAAAQADVDARIEVARKTYSENYLAEVTNLDLDLSVHDGYCRYAIQPSLLADPGEPVGNFLEHGALLGQAMAEVAQNRRCYDTVYAKWMAQYEASQGVCAPKPAPACAPAGSFADKLRQALHR